MVHRRPAGLSDEDGIALVIAIQVLAIMVLLATAALGSAISLHGTTARDGASKRALAGAISGLDVARYRLNRIDPIANMCLTDHAVAAGSGGAASGECPAYSGDLGNGNAYGYYVTPELAAGGSCGGKTVTAGSSSWRCVTAYGTSDGVTRRTQTMVSRTMASTSLFPMSGILGLDFVSIQENNHGNAATEVASNGPFTLQNCNGPVGGILIWKPGPTATMTENCSGTPTSAPPRSTPWTLSPLDAFISGTETVNDNAAVFGSASGFQYTAGTRDLKDVNNATLIINGSNPRTGSNGIWTFNLCKLTLTHVTQFKLQNGAVARFLVDSSERAGSGCNNTGKFDITNVSGMNRDTVTGVPGDPSNLQFFFYGSGNININNKSGFSAALYAPGAALKITNETKWYGAVAAKSVNATNGFDFVGADVSDIHDPNGIATDYARAGFVECRSARTTASDPESGC